jgi:uncharacterized membrane protein
MLIYRRSGSVHGKTVRSGCFPAALIIFTMCFLASAAVFAASDDDCRSERGFFASFRYPGITLGTEDSIRVDLLVKNIGRTNETFFLEITELPEGWRAGITDFSDVVTGVFLEKDGERTLRLTAEPEKSEDGKLPPGDYRFSVKAHTADNELTQTTSVKITVTEEEHRKGAIKLTTSYPVLRGPSDSKFEFSLDVRNDFDEDGLFNLSAAAPEGWDVSFKPAYEQKQISSLQIKANQSQSVSVSVVPPRNAEVGEYPVQVQVKSANASSDVQLTVVLTGTYDLKTGTADGLLSLTAQPGGKSNISIYVNNSGTAVQHEISFLSLKPENWDVEFIPEKIENLKPGELKQVEVSISPSESALVGDYMVGVSVQGEKLSRELELRVTLKASSAWGWVGIGIIVLVIAGLAVLFRILGRR